MSQRSLLRFRITAGLVVVAFGMVMITEAINPLALNLRWISSPFGGALLLIVSLVIAGSVVITTLRSYGLSLDESKYWSEFAVIGKKSPIRAISILAYQLIMVVATILYALVEVSLDLDLFWGGTNFCLAGIWLLLIPRTIESVTQQYDSPRPKSKNA